MSAGRVGVQRRCGSASARPLADSVVMLAENGNTVKSHDGVIKISRCFVCRPLG